jgi:signal recognition particle subunit SRP54
MSVDIDGVILTKLDGDARGGAALSVKRRHRQAHQVRLAPARSSTTRVLPPRPHGQPHPRHGRRAHAHREGRGDVRPGRGRRDGGAPARAEFTFDDFLKQIKMCARWARFKGIVALLPGIPKEIRDIDVDERQIARIEAIVLSMTTEERARPEIIDGSRRRRIAAGSGHDVSAVNQLIKQFDQMKKMMKVMMKGGGKLPPGFDPGAGGAMPGGMQLPGMPGGAFPGGGAPGRRRR